MTEAIHFEQRPISDFDWDDARQHIELVTGSADSKVWFRLFRDDEKSCVAHSIFGTLAECAVKIETLQAQRYGIFFVVNQGGSTDDSIQKVRAAFIDSDGVSLGSVRWHLHPDFIVLRDTTHWHAYWLTADVPVSEFRALQKRLAKRYGTDPTVCNPSRVLRLAGFNHLKNPDEPHRLRLIDYMGSRASDSLRQEAGHSLAELLDGLPEFPKMMPSAASMAAGTPITLDQFREWLSYIDPTFKDDQETWIGMALAIRYGELPVVSRDEIDWEQLLDDWCSGRLWAARTGDENFEPSTYHGREELLMRVRNARTVS